MLLKCNDNLNVITDITSLYSPSASKISGSWRVPGDRSRWRDVVCGDRITQQEEAPGAIYAPNLGKILQFAITSFAYHLDILKLHIANT